MLLALPSITPWNIDSTLTNVFSMKNKQHKQAVDKEYKEHSYNNGDSSISSNEEISVNVLNLKELKRIFADDEDTVEQLNNKKSQYSNRSNSKICSNLSQEEDMEYENFESEEEATEEEELKKNIKQEEDDETKDNRKKSMTTGNNTTAIGGHKNIEPEEEEESKSEAAEKKKAQNWKKNNKKNNKRQEEANEEQDQHNSSINNDNNIGTENKMKESWNTVTTKTTITIDTDLRNIELSKDGKSKEEITKEVKLGIKDAKICDLQLNIATPPNENNPKHYRKVCTAVVKIAEQEVKEIQQILMETELSKDSNSMDGMEEESEEAEKEVVKGTNSLEYHMAQAE